MSRVTDRKPHRARNLAVALLALAGLGLAGHGIVREELTASAGGGAVEFHAPRARGRLDLASLLHPRNPIRVTLEHPEITIRIPDRLEGHRAGVAEPKAGVPGSRTWPDGVHAVELVDARIRILHGDRVLVLDRIDGTLRRDGDAVAGKGSFQDRGRWTVSLAHDPGSALRARIELQDFPVDPLVAAFPGWPWHHPERTRLEGTLGIDGSETDTLRVEADLSLAQLALASPKLAEAPLEFPPLRFSGKLTLTRPGGKVAVETGTLEFGEVRTRITGGATWSGARRDLAVNFTLPPTPAATILEAIPDPVLAGWTPARLEGDLAGTLALRMNPDRPGDLKLEVAAQDHVRFLEAPGGVSAARLRQPFSHAVTGPDGRTHSMTTGPGSRDWVPLAGVSPFLIHAVLAHEDAAFLGHRGFAPWAIEAAVARNLKRGRFAWGASTISMQLARNLYLERDKVLARKVREAVLTWWLEDRLSKAEILALYLNVIEYGPGIYGLKAAAEHYFAKSPARLTPAESVFLACLLPAPRRYHRQLERKTLYPGFEEQMRFLLDHMVEKGRIDEEARRRGEAQLEHFTFRSGPEHQEWDSGWARDLPFATAPLPGRSRTE